MDADLKTKDCLDLLTDDQQEAKDRDHDFGMVKKPQGFGKRKRKASAMLITCLGDKTLKVVHKQFRYRRKMWARLCARYASKTTGNKLSLLTEAFSKTKQSESISEQILELEIVFARMEGARQLLNELTQVSFLLSSIQNDKN